MHYTYIYIYIYVYRPCAPHASLTPASVGRLSCGYPLF